MSVFRIHKNANFTVMSNYHFKEKKMSLKAKGLLALCLSLPDDWDYSINGLVAISKENLTAIRSGLKELEKLGHLKINKKKNEQGRFEYEYVIYETPAIENLHMENLTIGNRDVENMLQQSIEKESIKEQSINNIFIDINPALIPLYKEYLETRKSIQAPLTERGLKMLITRCNKLSNGNLAVQKLMLENAIMNGWKNVYKPKDQEIEANNQAQTNELKSFYGLQ